MSESDKNVTANRPVVRCTNRRRAMRPLALAAPVALLLLVAACSNDTSKPAASETPSPTASASSAGGSELTASVGENDKPVITMLDSAGAPVTSLKAGSYTVKVKDMSTRHDFHLTGPGVEEKTSIPETTEVTWTVTLAPGTYTFKCNPHAQMVGTFTVT